MYTHLRHAKTKGQSIPIIALMIVVLFAMVGLAVDVGNTYAEQRNTVRSSNAAALAGMNSLVHGGNDSSVYNAVVNSLSSNNIHVAAPGAQPQSGERTLTASYLDSSGNPITSCPNVGGCGTSTPQGVTYIQVNVTGQVDTFFARVVGRPTLPVGNIAFAAKGPCSTGVYPITIRDSYLDNNGFVNPDSRYSDELYKNKTLKRVTMKDPTNPNGGFDWVRWKAGQTNGNSTELTAMLTGDGNIDEGFNEAAWPSSNSLNLPKPAGYPLRPNQLNVGDWVYGNPGVSNSTNVRAELDWHIANRTVMILPIHDTDDGGGVNGNYHVSRLGAFLLRGYSLNGHGYFDLVYIGPAQECAVLVTNAPKTTNLGITGPVVSRPRAKVIPQSRPPIQYEIILDVSGSMTWTFAGQGWRNGHAIQCTGVDNGCTGVANAWPTVSARRIYVAKNALNDFIDNMGTNDSMRIVAFSGDNGSTQNNSSAINNLTKAWPTSGWSSDKTTLHDAVKSAGARNGDQYLTEGRTPSAVGIAAGNQVLSAAPTKAPDDQTYKRVVIFMTDGVANVFRDGSLPSYTGTCGSEIANCNVGYTTGGKAKPVTAMALEADGIKQLATVYVIALAGVDETGLRDVASAPNYPFFSSAQNGTDLPGIFASIATNVTEGDCVPTGGNTWQSTLPQENAAAVPPPSGPVTYPTVGYAYLYDQNGNTFANNKASISVDSQSGRLSYHFDNLAPGIYQMRAFVGYKGNDNVSRVYDRIFDPNTQTADTAISFTLKPSDSLGTVVARPTLYLDMTGSVCPAP